MKARTKRFTEGGSAKDKPEAPKTASFGKLLAFGALPLLAKSLSNPSLNPMKYILDQEEKKKKEEEERQKEQPSSMRRGGKVKNKVSSASKRADGCAVKGKTRGKFV